jgi:pyruvate/2-oxoacid:ferredoxin oxidoreductase beta subunit
MIKFTLNKTGCCQDPFVLTVFDGIPDALKKLLSVWDTDKLRNVALVARRELRQVARPSALLCDLILQSDCFALKINWILGGDGILDHVFESGENMNLLVLHTESTRTQCSKATHHRVIANFATADTRSRRRTWQGSR